MYTKKELQVLNYLYDVSEWICGRCDDEENVSYANAQDISSDLWMSLNEIGGILSSLNKKNAIIDTKDSARGARYNDWVIADWRHIKQLRG